MTVSERSLLDNYGFFRFLGNYNKKCKSSSFADVQQSFKSLSVFLGDKILRNAVGWYLHTQRDGMGALYRVLLPQVVIRKAFPSFHHRAGRRSVPVHSHSASLREHWMIYRGPGFLAVVWFGSLPNPSPLSNLSLFLSIPACRAGRAYCWEKGGRKGWRRSKIIRLCESLVLYKSSSTLWPHWSYKIEEKLTHFS